MSVRKIPVEHEYMEVARRGIPLITDYQSNQHISLERTASLV